MRYVFVSDIHGCYDKMITSLDAAKFNSNTDTLVSLGDPFDRGTQSYEVLDFILKCPNRIIVWGNHDARLKNLIYNKDKSNYNDYYNGMLETFRSFLQDNSITSIDIGISQLFNRKEYQETRRKIIQYFDEAIYVAEWDNLIATHAWLPVRRYEKIVNSKGYCKSDLELNLSWRISNEMEFYYATWANTEECIVNKLFPAKKMIIGHWHAHRIHMLYDKTLTDDKAPFTTFENNEIIAIDGCSNDPQGCVNTWIYETDKKPIFYKGEWLWR